MLLLQRDIHNEFASCQEGVRVVPTSDTKSSVLLKSNYLKLKYLILNKKLSFSLFEIANMNWLWYGFSIFDDPEHPAVIWSIAKKQEEVQAIDFFCSGKPVNIHIFDESLINVGSSKIKTHNLLTKRKNTNLLSFPNIDEVERQLGLINSTSTVKV